MLRRKQVKAEWENMRGVPFIVAGRSMIELFAFTPTLFGYLAYLVLMVKLECRQREEAIFTLNTFAAKCCSAKSPKVIEWRGNKRSCPDESCKHNRCDRKKWQMEDGWVKHLGALPEASSEDMGMILPCSWVELCGRYALCPACW